MYSNAYFFPFLSEEKERSRRKKEKETGAIIPRKSSRNTLRVLGFWEHKLPQWSVEYFGLFERKVSTVSKRNIRVKR